MFFCCANVSASLFVSKNCRARLPLSRALTTYFKCGRFLSLYSRTLCFLIKSLVATCCHFLKQIPVILRFYLLQGWMLERGVFNGKNACLREKSGGVPRWKGRGLKTRFPGVQSPPPPLFIGKNAINQPKKRLTQNKGQNKSAD